ncbi:uncharacterized protein V6R79_016462 [Siganus canaliculatus]
MAEPAGKRLKSSLPLCPAPPHRSSATARDTHGLQAAVEEALCGVSGLMRDGASRLQALAAVFERDGVALPRVAAFFHQEALKQEQEAEALTFYLSERRGSCCCRDVQGPACDAVGAVFPALELFLLQLKEEVAVMAELSQFARRHGDPLTASIVKTHFLSPRVERLKRLGDLLTSARRLGCTNEATGGSGEFILNELLR